MKFLVQPYGFYALHHIGIEINLNKVIRPENWNLTLNFYNNSLFDGGSFNTLRLLSTPTKDINYGTFRF